MRLRVFVCENMFTEFDAATNNHSLAVSGVNQKNRERERDRATELESDTHFQYGTLHAHFLHRMSLFIYTRLGVWLFCSFLISFVLWSRFKCFIFFILHFKIRMHNKTNRLFWLVSKIKLMMFTLQLCWLRECAKSQTNRVSNGMTSGKRFERI